MQSCAAVTLEMEKLKLREAAGRGQRSHSYSKCKSLASDPSLCTREGTLLPCDILPFPTSGGQEAQLERTSPKAGLCREGSPSLRRLTCVISPIIILLLFPGSSSPFCSGCTLDSWSFFREPLYLSAKPPLSAPRGLGPWPSRHCSSGSYLAASIRGPDYFLCGWGS